MSPSEDETFEAVYAAAREGSREARDVLVSSVRVRLERFIARRMGRDVRRRVEPDDIFQATVLTLFDRLATFPGDLAEEELRAYVFQIAKWKIADVMKTSPREVGESHLPPAASPAAPTPSQGPVTRTDERRWTRRQIAALPEKYAAVLMRYYVEGQNIARISQELGLNANLVKQRLSRGRALLRDRMAATPEPDAG